MLLLEAGPPNRHPLQDMPLAFARVANGRIGTYQYLTEPEPGLNHRRLPLPRGRTLGGTSAINAMIAIRGHARDYDGWGVPGWTFAEVLPWFRKLESHWRGADHWHGGDGPVAISQMRGDDMLFEALAEAAAALGIPHNEDANGAAQDGISRMESTVRAGRRASSARAYLDAARARPNLTIATNAPARRIVIERGRAVAVEYGQGHCAKAEREIILCAGAYNSPQVLLLSGIGPADELRALGIAPVHDLPGVGRNLADHPNIISEWELAEDAGLTRHLRLDRAARAAWQWAWHGSGPFACTGTSANLFLHSQAGLPQPDIQLMTMPVSGDAGLWLAPRAPARISVRAGYLHPRSRGWVRLRSADPRDPPRILINMFGEDHDLDQMVRALEWSRDLHAQAPLAGMIRHERLPGPAVQSREDMRAHIRAHAGHRSHPVGTCRMGEGADAVVDGQLRVHGIAGLRVADASIMPAITSGNTNLPCLMIGEKAAAMIAAA